MVQALQQYVLYGLHSKNIPFFWVQLSEFGNSIPDIPTGSKAVVITGVTGQDQYRKTEKLRDLLSSVPPGCGVYIITEGLDGVSGVMQKFGLSVTGGFLSLERSIIEV